MLIFLSAKPEYVPCTVGGDVGFSSKIHANIPQKARILFSLKLIEQPTIRETALPIQVCVSISPRP